MLARFYKVYLPALDVPAILCCLSITLRVGGHGVALGGLILLSTGPTVHELALPPSVRLRGDDLLKKYAKCVWGDFPIKITQKYIRLQNFLIIRLNCNF